MTAAGRASVPVSERGRDVCASRRRCVIRLDELEWRTTGSGGPGGQHANTSDTRVEVRFDVATSPSLGPRQRARLLERLGPVVRATASDTRSQARNRELALERLRARLADGAAGRPAPAGHQAHEGGAGSARLDAKRRQSAPQAATAAGPPRRLTTT